MFRCGSLRSLTAAIRESPHDHLDAALKLEHDQLWGVVVLVRC